MDFSRAGPAALITVLGLAAVGILVFRAAGPDMGRERDPLSPEQSQEAETSNPPDHAVSASPNHGSGSGIGGGLLAACELEGAATSTEPVVVEVRRDTTVRGESILLRQPCRVQVLGGVTLHIADTRVKVSRFLMIEGHSDAAAVRLDGVDVQGGRRSSFGLELSEAEGLAASVVDTNIEVGYIIAIQVLGDGPDAEPGGDLEVAGSSFRVTDRDAYGVGLGAGGEGVFTAVNVDVPSEAVELIYATSCTIDGKRDACGPNSVLE